MGPLPWLSCWLRLALFRASSPISVGGEVPGEGKVGRLPVRCEEAERGGWALQGCAGRSRDSSVPHTKDLLASSK